MTSTYGEVIPGLVVDGRELHAGVFNEHQVRAAAGITMALGAVAFVYANFEKVFWPIQLVSTFFFLDFALRVGIGLRGSPVGIVAGWMTRRVPPMWVSAKPKRFAWTMGVVMSGAMAVITNVGIRGVLPRTICLVCLVLMWLEAVLGLCVGCELHAALVRRGLVDKDEDYEICAGGVCDISARPPDPDRR